jgi:hypothetical protein
MGSHTSTVINGHLRGVLFRLSGMQILSTYRQEPPLIVAFAMRSELKPPAGFDKKA